MGCFETFFAGVIEKSELHNGKMVAIMNAGIKSACNTLYFMCENYHYCYHRIYYRPHIGYFKGPVSVPFVYENK